MLQCSHLGFIGLGLIGGSLARAVKVAGYGGVRVGYSPDPDERAQALALGVVDQAAASIEVLAEAVDGVIVAVPPRAMADVFAALQPSLRPHAIVTDVGSVKVEVVAAAETQLGPHWPRFVPGHPLAGAEQSGVAASRQDLFQGHRVLLTPVAATAPEAVAAVTALWQSCGAEVECLSPGEHDALLALTSHLPHLLAYALVGQVTRQSSLRDPFRYTGGGFRDFTRIAASDPALWVDIILANQGPILAALADYRAELDQLLALIEAADADGLHTALIRAQSARLAYSIQRKEVHGS